MSDIMFKTNPAIDMEDTIDVQELAEVVMRVQEAMNELSRVFSRYGDLKLAGVEKKQEDEEYMTTDDESGDSDEEDVPQFESSPGKPKVQTVEPRSVLSGLSEMMTLALRVLRPPFHANSQERQEDDGTTAHPGHVTNDDLAAVEETSGVDMVNDGVEAKQAVFTMETATDGQDDDGVAGELIYGSNPVEAAAEVSGDDVDLEAKQVVDEASMEGSDGIAAMVLFCLAVCLVVAFASLVARGMSQPAPVAVITPPAWSEDIDVKAPTMSLYASIVAAIKADLMEALDYM